MFSCHWHINTFHHIWAHVVCMGVSTLTWVQVEQHPTQDDGQQYDHCDASEVKPADGFWANKTDKKKTWCVRFVALLPLCGSSVNCSDIYVTWYPLTFNIQNETLFDGHSQGLMSDTACKLFAWVPERSLEVEESRQREGLVHVVFVAGLQDVLQHLGERSTDPLARHCRVLLIPNYLHIQRVVVLCLTNHLLLRALLQCENRSNAEGDTGRLWGEDEKIQVKTISARGFRLQVPLANAVCNSYYFYRRELLLRFQTAICKLLIAASLFHSIVNRISLILNQSKTIIIKAFIG